ncbi:MAG: sigma-70 family RNA polymerase sigma factor [Solirubrobacteraceae bacterium]|nr:sigma-70 family RNA polymerase sigma factor [Solirubrobacteraceae bacterium]
METAKSPSDTVPGLVPVTDVSMTAPALPRLAPEPKATTGMTDLPIHAAPAPATDDGDDPMSIGSSRRRPLDRMRSAADAHHERRIARRLAQRDPQGLAELHALTGRAAYGVILGIVRDRGHAEDIHQQTFAELWRRADQFDPRRGTLLAWVLTVARSRALDHLRRRADAPVDDDALVALGGASEDRAFQDVIDRAYVAEALDRLPAQERDLLRMRFWEGLSQQEIAERTGVPLGTVKSRMLAGLRTLRLHLETQGAA